VVSAALDRRACIITGAPGMGKSTVAVAAAYDPQIITLFGQRRVFVSLDNRSDPLDLLILLASELGLTTEPTHNSTLAAIRYACGLAPAFAILDNAEGLIEADDVKTSRLLGLLRDTPGLSFVVTSFENLPGLAEWERLDDLSPLTFEDARSLFCGIATKIQPDDSGLKPLLIALDGHALSLNIVASRVDSDLHLKPMLERWQHEKAGLLRKPGSREDRRNSVRASLRLSLTSHPMTGMANRLLKVLGFLPDGLPAGGLKAFLGHEDRQITTSKSNDAIDALRRPDWSLLASMDRSNFSIHYANAS
jgi:predicted ATPase